MNFISRFSLLVSQMEVSCTEVVSQSFSELIFTEFHGVLCVTLCNYSV